MPAKPISAVLLQMHKQQVAPLACRVSPSLPMERRMGCTVAASLRLMCLHA